jgi:MFS transporter, ACS family, D-galactonate transporter
MHTVPTDTPAAMRPEPGRRQWSRQLGHYPPTRTRLWNLGLVVAITIVFYYQVYVAGAVSTHILRTFDMSFRWYVSMVVVSYALGGLASFCAGLADRYGRANIILGGLLITSLLTLAVSTSSDTTAWQDQYIRCGLAGLAIWLAALAGLRELAPRLRDQLMVSARDRALIEARAKGIDVEAALRRPFRQVLKLDIVGSAFAIAVFLIMYYLAVGFLPVFFQTVFGFSQSTASSLGNWFWAGQAVALVVTGVVSDRLRVRKPFMLIGAIGAVITTTVFALRATQHATSYQTFAVLLTLLAVCIGITYAPWMASFTETVERRNPALTATGLAAWGMITRLVVAVSIVVLPHVVTTATTLVQDGPRVQAAVTGTDPALTAAQNATVKAVAAQPAILAKARSLAAAYAPELATAAKFSQATKTALAADPAGGRTPA